MKQLSEEYGVDMGTGYPHDPLTIQFLRNFIREHGKAPVIARSSWITTQRLIDKELHSNNENK